MSRLVHIIAISARTPVGYTAETTAAAIRARISRVREHAFMVDAAGNPLQCGYDTALLPETLGPQRLVALADAALGELIDKLKGYGAVPNIHDVAVALPEVRPGFSARDAMVVLHGLKAPRTDLDAIDFRGTQHGHAGGLEVIGRAVELISGGQADLCVVGGVDSYLEADTIDWLEAEMRLAREGLRGGFPPGEGAGFLALASDSLRRRLRAPSLARVRGVGTAQERRLWDSDEGLLGEGLSEAVLKACATLRLPSEKVDDLYNDLNGERLRTDDWGFALLRMQHVLKDVGTYHMSMSEIGETGAATGILNCVLSMRAWARNYARGPLSLIVGSAWNGERAAVVLEEGAG